MLPDTVHNSTSILVPKGRDHDGCVSSFSETFSVEVPVFEGRVLSLRQNGKKFTKVRSSDMPVLMEAGFGDIGLAYSDVWEEYAVKDSNLAYERIGGRHQSFCLLLPEAKAESLQQRLASFSDPPVQVVTTYPVLFNKCLTQSRDKGTPLNMEVSPIAIGGCTEAMVALGVAEIVADVVNTGETARANNLIPLHLFDIYPGLIYRKTPTV